MLMSRLRSSVAPYEFFKFSEGPRVCELGKMDSGLNAVAISEFPGKRLEEMLSTAMQDQVVPICPQSPGKCSPDSGGSSRDDSCLRHGTLSSSV